jgi:hypothetical protein
MKIDLAGIKLHYQNFYKRIYNISNRIWLYGFAINMLNIIN